MFYMYIKRTYKTYAHIKHIKRGAKIEPLASLLFPVLPALTPQGCIFFCLPSKTEL